MKVSRPDTKRYTFEFLLKPSDQIVELRVVTAMGTLKAVAMAAGRLQRDRPVEQIYQVELIGEDRIEEIEDSGELLDYWELK